MQEGRYVMERHTNENEKENENKSAKTEKTTTKTRKRKRKSKKENANDKLKNGWKSYDRAEKRKKAGTEFPNEKKRKKKNDGKPSLFLFVCIVAFRFKHLDCVVRQIRIHFSYGFDWGVQFFKNHFCGFFVLL